MNNADLVYAMYAAAPTNYVFGGSRYSMSNTDCSGMVDGAFYEVFGINPYSIGTWTGSLWTSPLLDYIWSGTSPYLPWDSMKVGDVIFTSTTSSTYSTGEGSHVGFYTGDPSAPFISHFANGGPYVTAVNGVYGGSERYYGVRRYTPGSEDDMEPVDVWAYKNKNLTNIDTYQELFDVHKQLTRTDNAGWGTPAGHDIYGRVNSIQKDVTTIKSAVSKLQTGGSGTVSIDYDKLANKVADVIYSRMKA